MPEISALLERHFEHQPTVGQKRFFQLFDGFFNDRTLRCAMILRGYAGTGKTSIVSALVKVLPLFNYSFVLLAPTGRAAKVMSHYSRKVAFTIHKRIYKQKGSPTDGTDYSLQKNYSKNTLFIIDESSMLSNEQSFGKKGLLDDLISYVFSNDGNRILFIGDTAQLPPVFHAESPALEAEFLQETYRIKVYETVLTEVMRQAEASGILANATRLRQQLFLDEAVIQLSTSGYKDIFRMTGERLEDGLRYAYDKFGEHETVVICRSNKAAVMYNEYIRRQIRFTENELEAGDMLMIVRNNYLFSPESMPGGFLANGDFVEVRKIITTQELYGYRFADLELAFVDYPDLPSFEAKVILDTLHQAEASLPETDYKKLYVAVKEDYTLNMEKTAEVKDAMKKDPFLNALQIKFAYALTCHKSQGGQWSAVFVDQGYLTEDMLNKEYFRWLYTAITRAKSELFLVNFNSSFFIA